MTPGLRLSLVLAVVAVIMACVVAVVVVADKETSTDEVNAACAAHNGVERWEVGGDIVICRDGVVIRL